MLELLVVQPTPFCNINCSYCYLAERSNTSKITPETVRAITYRLLEDKSLLGKQLTVVLHAGEPLVLNPDFYRPLFEIFSELNTATQLGYSLQTNGTLITQDWCDFIKEYDIRIGVSIDGPQFINDKNRLSRNGKSTFEATMKGIELLRRNNIQTHAIAVVTETSLDHPEAIFNFFHDNGFYHLGLNIEELEGTHTTSALYAAGADKRILDFYTRMLELYKQSDGGMLIREFFNSRNAIFRNLDVPDITLLPSKTHQTEPFSIISVDYNGNFSTFSPELLGQNSAGYNNFILGNVHKDSLSQVLNTPLMKQWTTEVALGIDNCRNTCQYFSVCGGGSPGNKYYENGSFGSTETKYCKYHIQMPIDIVLADYEQQLAIKV